MKEMAEVRWRTSANDYNVLGVPFFTEQNNEAFYDVFDKEIIANTISFNQKKEIEKTSV